MRRSFFASSGAPGAVVALVSSVCLSLCPAAGWAQTTESEGAPPPRTPWGDPNIGGLWNSSTVTPLERPEAQADKEFLTEEEAAAIERQVVDRNNRANAPSVVRTEPLPVGGNVGAYNNFWLDRGTTVVPTRRTSLIVDPPNGRLPPLTPDAQRRRSSAERQRLTAVREGRVPADSYGRRSRTSRERSRTKRGDAVPERAPDCVYVIYIAARADKVWNGLRDRELTKAYWGHYNVSDWKPGSVWEHVRSDGSDTVDIVGTVDEIDPPRRLVISWAFPHEAQDETKVSRVTFELTPLGPDTRLKVIHSDLEPGSEMQKGIRRGLAGCALEPEDVARDGTNAV